jgi:hypothetical protein
MAKITRTDAVLKLHVCATCTPAPRVSYDASPCARPRGSGLVWSFHCGCELAAATLTQTEPDSDMQALISKPCSRLILLKIHRWRVSPRYRRLTSEARTQNG